jgi:hypothetical protein
MATLRERAVEKFKQHWLKRTGKEADATTLAHMSHVIDAMVELIEEEPEPAFKNFTAGEVEHERYRQLFPRDEGYEEEDFTEREGDWLKEYRLRNGVAIRIYHDEHPDNPRVDETQGVMAAFHRRYDLTDKGVPFKDSHFDGFKEMEERVKSLSEVYLPLYLLDHSGLSISTTPFSNSWDSGQVGFIYMTKETAAVIAENRTEPLEHLHERMRQILKDEVEVFDRYLRGEVYGFKIVTIRKCELGHEHAEENDSCWGFFTGTDLAMNGMVDFMPEELVAELTEIHNIKFE